MKVDAVTTQGNPAQEILRQAQDFEADLVILGTHGRSALERFFLGSVAQKTVRNAPCPVLTVKPDGFVSPVALEDVERDREVEIRAVAGGQ